MSYDYGSIMARTWPDGWDDVLESIDKRDVYTAEDGTYGIETNPHVTILYGLHEEVHEDLVCRICQGVGGPLEVDVKGVSTFDNEDYEVLKFDVDSDLLRKMNKAFRGLPHTNDYDDYNPHMTVAYLRPGTSSKYIENLNGMVPDKIPFERFEFSPPGGEDSINFSV